jgi:hypothetical protein
MIVASGLYRLVFTGGLAESFVLLKLSSLPEKPSEKREP